MPQITKNDKYRTLGRMAYEMWVSIGKELGAPAELLSRGAYDAAGELNVTVAAIMFRESKWQTKFNANSRENNNPGNIRVRDRSNEDNPKGYVAYPSLVAGVAAIRGRINGEAGYFDGVNPYAFAVTIAQMIETYAPRDTQGGRPNDTDDYIREFVANANRWMPNWAGPVQSLDPTTGVLTFGRGVRPAAKYMPLTKEYGAGVDYRVAVKKIGVTAHETQLDVAGDGVQELDFWYDFFNCPNGERCDDAGCHYIVSTNGLAYCLIDPLGNMEPWVNGGSPAPANEWNRTFGSGMRNALLYGVENNKRKGGPLSQGQINWLGQLLAFALDDNKVPWYQFPYYKGVSQLQQHRYLAPTDCMFPPEQAELIIAVSKVWGQKWQLGTDQAPSGPVDQKPVELFPGVDIELAKRWFGKVLLDGRTYQLTWPLGPAASLWVENGKQTGRFAPLESVEPYQDGRMYLRFRDGLTLWKSGKDADLEILKFKG